MCERESAWLKEKYILSVELAVDERGRYILVGTMYNGLYLVGCIP